MRCLDPSAPLLALAPVSSSHFSRGRSAFLQHPHHEISERREKILTGTTKNLVGDTVWTSCLLHLELTTKGLR